MGACAGHTRGRQRLPRARPWAARLSGVSTMNLALKCLAALACIAVILASGVFLLRQLDTAEPPSQALLAKSAGGDKADKANTDAGSGKSEGPKGEGPTPEG